MERFFAAVAGDDLQPLVDVLAPDVVMLTDGGGVKRAALKPVLGVDKVMRFLTGIYDAAFEARIITVGGAPAMAFDLDGELEAVATFTVEDGQVTHAYVVRNPHKLGAVGVETHLSR